MTQMSPGSMLQTQGVTQKQVLPTPETESLLFQDYTPHSKAWDELFAEPGHGHDYCQVLLDRLGRLNVREFHERRTSADLAFINNGITFSVYSDRRGTEKIFPFDLIPRPVAGKEWDRLEAGLIQRIRALNIFLDDVYHDQRILAEGVIPANLVLDRRASAPR